MSKKNDTAFQKRRAAKNQRRRNSGSQRKRSRQQRISVKPNAPVGELAQTTANAFTSFFNGLRSRDDESDERQSRRMQR